MHFRLRYVMDGMRLELGEGETLKFPFGGEHRVVVSVLQAVEENNRKKLICEAVSEENVDQSVQQAFGRFTAGVPLEANYRAFFDEVLSDLYAYMHKVVSVLRWRHSIMDGPLRPFSRGTEGYSFDGMDWRDEPRRAAFLKMLFGHPYPKGGVSEKLSEEIVALVKRDIDEPLERQLFREAWNLKEDYPKAALVLGVAAAEIGFRRLVGGRRGKISRLLAKYWPHPSPIPKVQGRELKPSASILEILENGFDKRNAVVHRGAPAPDQEELREILWNISQLLWIWDFYHGHTWALEHLSANSLSN